MALLTRFSRRAVAAGALRGAAPLLQLQRRTAPILLPPTESLPTYTIAIRAFAAEAKWGVMNDEIRARVVQLVADDGKMQANVPLGQALAEARRRGVDLVQVSSTGDRVVCRMFDAKKRIFSMKKAAKPLKPKQDKEVVFGVKIEAHDIKVKVEHVKKFLAKGHKVKVTVKFAQQYHLKNKALETIKAVQELIVAENAGAADADAAPREQFGGVYTYFSPGTGTPK